MVGTELKPYELESILFLVCVKLMHNLFKYYEKFAVSFGTTSTGRSYRNQSTDLQNNLIFLILFL